MTEETILVCICGKDLPPGQIVCSERCRWITEKMKSPMGQNIGSTERAVRFFGKIYDKQQAMK